MTRHRDLVTEDPCVTVTLPLLSSFLLVVTAPSRFESAAGNPELGLCAQRQCAESTGGRRGVRAHECTKLLQQSLLCAVYTAGRSGEKEEGPQKKMRRGRRGLHLKEQSVEGSGKGQQVGRAQGSPIVEATPQAPLPAHLHPSHPLQFFSSPAGTRGPPPEARSITTSSPPPCPPTPNEKAHSSLVRPTSETRPHKATSDMLPRSRSPPSASRLVVRTRAWQCTCTAPPGCNMRGNEFPRKSSCGEWNAFVRELNQLRSVFSALRWYSTQSTEHTAKLVWYCTAAEGEEALLEEDVMWKTSHLSELQVSHVGTSVGSTRARLHRSGDMDTPSKAHRDVHLPLLLRAMLQCRLLWSRATKIERRQERTSESRQHLCSWASKTTFTKAKPEYKLLPGSKCALKFRLLDTQSRSLLQAPSGAPTGPRQGAGFHECILHLQQTVSEQTGMPGEGRGEEGQGRRRSAPAQTSL